MGISLLYTGLILLDRKKRVFSAVSARADLDLSTMIGSSYAGIDFQDGEDSLYKLLILYRADKTHPMGHKGIELAFEIRDARHLLGWLLFQLDMGNIEREYGVSEKDLANFQFKKP